MLNSFLAQVLERKKNSSKIKCEEEDACIELAMTASSSSPSPGFDCQQQQQQQQSQPQQCQANCDSPLSSRSLMFYNPRANTCPVPLISNVPSSQFNCYEENVAPFPAGNSFIPNNIFPSSASAASNYISIAFNMWRMHDGLETMAPSSSSSSSDNQLNSFPS